MIEDPYKILGVAQSATQDEIRKAYRRKAKEYHPDLHPNDPAANRKMNEVNEAYDMLMNPQKYEAKRAQQTQSRQNQSEAGQQRSSNSYQGPGGWASDFNSFSFEDFFGFGFTEPPGQNGRMPQTESSDSPEIRRVILAINNGRNQEALNILFHIPSYGRNARWYYLSGLANHNLGNTVQAADHMQKAVQMDPNNRMYHQLLQQFRQSGRTYEQNARSFNMREIEMNKMCCGLMAAPICCGPVGCMPCYI